MLSEATLHHYKVSVVCSLLRWYTTGIRSGSQQEGCNKNIVVSPYAFCKNLRNNYQCDADTDNRETVISDRKTVFDSFGRLQKSA